MAWEGPLPDEEGNLHDEDQHEDDPQGGVVLLPRRVRATVGARVRVRVRVRDGPLCHPSQ